MEEENKYKPLCERCAGLKNLEPITGGFSAWEPCRECGSFPTQFESFLKPKITTDEQNN